VTTESRFTALRQLYLDDAFGQAGFWTRLPRMDTPALFIWGRRIGWYRPASPGT